MIQVNMLHDSHSWFNPESDMTHPGFDVCVLSTFNGMHRQHMELLEYALSRSDGGSPSGVLVLMAEDRSAGDAGLAPMLLTLEERLQLIRNRVSARLAFGRVDISPHPKGPQADRAVLYFKKSRLLIPGPDLLRPTGDAGRQTGLAQLAESLEVPVDRRFDSSRQIDLTPTLVGHITHGRMEQAIGLTGYAYPLSGVVVEGNKIGRTLGYPTANLGRLHPAKVIPGQGVYAAMVSLGGFWYEGMVNIGIRPTLDLENVTIEAHLFGFEGDVYGREITIHFLERTRDEMRFSSLAELKHQLQADKESIRDVLKRMSGHLSRTAGFLLVRSE
jgi:riboflavin kinase / FMN adenylyltransferase